MTLKVILCPPTSIGGDCILLKVEKLNYSIHRNVAVANFANQDKLKIIDYQASILEININGIVTSVAEMQKLITAARTWWVAGSTSTSNVTTLAKISWRDRPYQYMVIGQSSITDMAETDDHEFEYSLDIKIDTRTS